VPDTVTTDWIFLEPASLIEPAAPNGTGAPAILPFGVEQSHSDALGQTGPDGVLWKNTMFAYFTLLYLNESMLALLGEQDGFTGSQATQALGQFGQLPVSGGVA
jgi:hypothetical protein